MVKVSAAKSSGCAVAMNNQGAGLSKSAGSTIMPHSTATNPASRLTGCCWGAGKVIGVLGDRMEKADSNGAGEFWLEGVSIVDGFDAYAGDMDQN